VHESPDLLLLIFSLSYVALLIYYTVFRRRRPSSSEGQPRIGDQSPRSSACSPPPAGTCAPARQPSSRPGPNPRRTIRHIHGLEVVNRTCGCASRGGRTGSHLSRAKEESKVQVPPRDSLQEQTARKARLPLAPSTTTSSSPRRAPSVLTTSSVFSASQLPQTPATTPAHSVMPKCRHPAHADEFRIGQRVSKLCSRCNATLPSTSSGTLLSSPMKDYAESDSGISSVGEIIQGGEPHGHTRKEEGIRPIREWAESHVRVILL